MEKYGCRTDCTRDNRQVKLPRVYEHSGWQAKQTAKRGDWLTYQISAAAGLLTGRVVGRVVCEGQEYVEVISAAADFTSAYIRWVKPEDVHNNSEHMPAHIFRLFMGDWTDPDAILTTVSNGLLPDHLKAGMTVHGAE